MVTTPTVPVGPTSSLTAARPLAPTIRGLSPARDRTGEPSQSDMDAPIAPLAMVRSPEGPMASTT